MDRQEVLARRLAAQQLDRPPGGRPVTDAAVLDLWLQARDREVVVPEKERHKALWPTIGRPGAVLVGTDVVGTWRPKAAGRKLTITLEVWQRVPPATRALVGQQAERLALHRGSTLTGVVWS